MAPDKPLAAATATCPICGRSSETRYRPFCSRRCADIDLSRWLRGSYAIPDAAESEDGEGAESDAPHDGDEDGKPAHVTPSSRRGG
jgi:endogenous inhibitor of DNA gyrase (YacG/DUF329 family)